MSRRGQRFRLYNIRMFEHCTNVNCWWSYVPSVLKSVEALEWYKGPECFYKENSDDFANTMDISTEDSMKY